MIAAVDSAKTVFLFPGVGAQRPHMFREFQTYPEYRACLEEVSDLSGVDLHEVIHGDQRDTLKQVRIAQLALTATTVALARILRHYCGLIPDFVMGHSLGQYPALCAAGYLDLATVTRIVSLRSEVVGTCAQRFKEGEMCWVLHIAAEVVVQEVEMARQRDGVAIYVSAIDAYDQATISGEMAQIRRFAPRMEAMGGLLYPLKIGGPFHSPLMAEAQAVLEPLLDFLDAAGQVAQISRLICNVTSAELSTERVKSSVLEHLVSPVRWLRSLQYVAEEGVTRYLEISPKSVLSYLTQRTGLPIRSMCEPENLFALTQELSTTESRLQQFQRRSYGHLYGSRLRDIQNALAIEQLRRIRAEVRRRVKGSRANSEECDILHQCTQQWLDIVENQAGVALSVEKATLRSLYESARRSA
jgi:[acyl-carrier-protein] S-malonyltransferase